MSMSRNTSIEGQGDSSRKTLEDEAFLKLLGYDG